MVFLMLFLSLAVGYILGSFNMSLIISRLAGVDIKKRGSGNAGLTNAARVMGPRAAVVVFIGDVLKAVLASYLGYMFTKGQIGASKFLDVTFGNIGVMIAGTGCIVGHVFPVFFGFSGGKGALTSMTVIFMMDFRIALIVLCVFIIIVLISRYVSLGSMTAAISLPIISLLFKKPPHFILYAVVIPLLIVLMHRKNIGRLISGTEPKIKFK